MADWFDPKTLDAAQAEAYRSSTDSPLIGGDYGSYAIANRGGGLSVSGVSNHNLIFGAHRVAQYAAVLGGRRFNRIADIGCGLGITTDALARHYRQAEVLGLEVSQDAIEFARIHFNGPKFVRMAISPSEPLPGLFDLILCQEFYPFTRTPDRDVHRSYIEYFLAHLQLGGVLLIELSERDFDKGILATIDDLGFSFENRRLPFDRIYRLLPIFPLAVFASAILSAVLSKASNRCVVIRKRV